MGYKKYITPIEAHDAVMANVARINRLNEVASTLFPLEDNELRTSFKGLTKEQRDEVYENC